MSAPEDLGSLASQVTADYSQLAVQGRLAAATAEPEEVIYTRMHGRSLFLILSHTLTHVLAILDRVPVKDTCAGTRARLHSSRPEGWSAADQSIRLVHKEGTYGVCTSRHWEGTRTTQSITSDALLTTYYQRVCCSLLKCQFIHIAEGISVCVCVFCRCLWCCLHCKLVIRALKPVSLQPVLYQASSLTWTPPSCLLLLVLSMLRVIRTPSLITGIAQIYNPTG